MSLGPAAYERAILAAGLGDITVFHRLSTGSTNDDARALVSCNPPVLDRTVAIVVAETQTKGRGRGTNVWLSAKGSIALTITAPGVAAQRLGVLPLGVGACVTAALRQLGAAACVKWPNDVLIGDEKVCGILCESSVLSGIARVFIGIGINVGAESTDPAPTPGATTLFAHGLTVDRPSLVAEITARVVRLIHGGASGAQIVETWKALAIPWWGNEVTFVEGKVERRVTILDVSPDGQLLVRDEGGAIRSLVCGEVRAIKAARP